MGYFTKMSQEVVNGYKSSGKVDIWTRFDPVAIDKHITLVEQLRPLKGASIPSNTKKSAKQKVAQSTISQTDKWAHWDAVVKHPDNKLTELAKVDITKRGLKLNEIPFVCVNTSGQLAQMRSRGLTKSPSTLAFEDRYLIPIRGSGLQTRMVHTVMNLMKCHYKLFILSLQLIQWYSLKGV